MSEGGLTTLAEARRQARTRALIGGLLLTLALLFLGLFAVKHLYYSTPAFPLLPDWGAGLRQFIDPLVHNWLVLALLWRAIPPWQPVPAVPTTPMPEYVYFFCGIAVVMAIGGLLLNSASRRRAQIMDFYREREREAWRQEARGSGQATPDPRGLTAVIQQNIWHQYAAPPEPWYQRPWGIVLLGILVGVCVLIAEYWLFQGGK
jgi:hypothetical protein